MRALLLTIGFIVLALSNQQAEEPKAPEDPLLVDLKSDAQETRLSAIGRIEKLNAIPDAYIAALLEEAMRSLDKTDERTVGLSMLLKTKSRGLIAKVGNRAVPALRVLMKDDASRWETVETLQRMGEAALPALPELTAALADKNEHIRYFAAKAIMQLGPKASSAVPELTKLISDPEESAREYAIRALGAIGADSKPALAALTKAAKDADFFTKKRASEAIQRIQEAGKTAEPKQP